MARDPNSLVSRVKYHNAYQCYTFWIVFSLGINLAMFMCFELCPFSYFEFALNLFMNEIGCYLVEPSNMVFVPSIVQWLQSGFHVSTLIALFMHSMKWMKP